jgi:hypothetical protein
MGPRLCRRGNQQYARHALTHLPGFNGATPLQTWKLVGYKQYLYGYYELQWGHAFADVETALL